MRISITGPESSGKSVLSKQLAKHVGAGWVPEFARTYLEHHNGDVSLLDLVNICRGQLKAEREMEAQCRDIVCDTDFLVLKIWAQVVFAEVPIEIEEAFKKQKYDLILLCKPDLEWEPDPLRTMPDKDDRMRLFEQYKTELIDHGCSFQIVEGQGESRFRLALGFLSDHKRA